MGPIVVLLKLVLQALLDVRLGNTQIRRELRALEANMVSKADFDAAHAEEMGEIARIAAKVDELLGKVAGGGMTADEEAAALADAQSEIAALKAITGEPPVA